MTGKLRAALLQHGWMEERITNYDRANRLTVNLEHEGENPIQMHSWGVLITSALFRAKQITWSFLGPPIPPKGNNLKSC